MAYLAMFYSCLHAEEEKKEVPDFRPAQVAPTTNGVSPEAKAERPPDGMASDLPVALDKSVSLNKIFTFQNDRKTVS